MNKNSESGHLCLVLYLSRNAFHISLSSMMLAVNFLQLPFIRLGKFLFVPSMLSDF